MLVQPGTRLNFSRLGISIDERKDDMVYYKKLHLSHTHDINKEYKSCFLKRILFLETTINCIRYTNVFKTQSIDEEKDDMVYDKNCIHL